MNVLITGGTVFVSRYAAEYFASRGHNVYVLNRNTMPQPVGAMPIIADRHDLRDRLRDYSFDAVIDVTAYNAYDVIGLLNALDGFDKLVLISSGAVYPETAPQPFKETTVVGANKYWSDYGLGKIAAERALTERVPNAYIIRPPYIYGEYNNLYREAFMFDCAAEDRPAYLPDDKSFALQFIHVEDVCRFAEILITKTPKQKLYNIGTKPVTASDWARACYAAAGKTPQIKYVDKSVEQRSYFPFHAYRYVLDTAAADSIMPNTITLENGLKRAYKQYMLDSSYVRRKNYLQFIAENLRDRE